MDGRVRLFGIGAAVLVVALLAMAMWLWLSSLPRGLEYEGLHRFAVGQYEATIETQSYEIAQGDNGAAKLIVVAAGRETVLEAHFNRDFFMDIRPAYVSWAWVDGDWRRDLLIWQDDYSGGLVANHYVASGDGRLHVLRSPLRQ